MTVAVESTKFKISVNPKNPHYNLTSPTEQAVSSASLSPTHTHPLITPSHPLEQFATVSKMLSAAARAIPRSRLQLRAVSTWSNVPAGPPDPILGMAQCVE